MSDDPDPLGKPTRPYISDNKTGRGWDPTDPDSNNPWFTYTESEPTLIQTPTPTSTPEAEATPKSEE